LFFMRVCDDWMLDVLRRRGLGRALRLAGAEKPSRPFSQVNLWSEVA